MAQVTAAEVQAAIAECDRLGREEFLRRYGFKLATKYQLRFDGADYDSKAIYGVAHKFLPGGDVLTSDKFSGGMNPSDAAARLVALGFEIVGPEDDVDWTWDEHVLALDLYMARRNAIPGKTSKPVLELSALLNRLAERRGMPRSEKFRNANGVYMKLMNFRRLDPEVQAAGRVGLRRGAKGEKAVWDAYADDVESLAKAAAAIRLAVEDEDVILAGLDEQYEADESGVILRLHKSRERDRKLIEKKKAASIATTGRLVCEVCEFDFEAAYGPVGEGFIEAHHCIPVSTLRKGQKTRMADLVLVCANCHRMLHRGPSLLSVTALREQLRSPLRLSPPLAVSA